MTDSRQDDPAVIEQDIRDTQDRIGDTIGKLEDQLSPPQLARAVMGDDGSEIAETALEVTRQNPIPVALIAIGAIWLIATARTKSGVPFYELLLGSSRRDRQPSRAASPAAEPPAAGSTAGEPLVDDYLVTTREGEVVLA